MTAAGAKCRACFLPMGPGEALRVTPTDGDPPYYVHRPTLAAPCFVAAGIAERSRIAFADPAAAAEFDHLAGGTRKPMRSEGRAGPAAAQEGA